jgi:hypothetical protein
MAAAGSFFNFICTPIALLASFFVGSCTRSPYFSKFSPINDSSFKGKVIVEKIEKIDKYRIAIIDSVTGRSDHIFTPYDVFEMETGDVNHDGRTDICIGIIKPTPFDPVLKKRLFIFQIDRDYIRPLWLSSRLVRPLEEFTVLNDKDGCRIRTIERANPDLFCISEYRWESFGLTFIKILSDSLHYPDAHALLFKRNNL